MNTLHKLLMLFGARTSMVGPSPASSTPANVNAEIAPTGKLRVGMNGSNATLVKLAADGSASGISVDLGKFIADRLGLPFEPLVYASAAAYTESFDKEEWDIIVTGRNPHAATLVDFLPDVILIDYVYIAAPGCKITDVAQVDRAGIRIGVPQNASADAFLSRRLKSAQLVRTDGGMASALEALRSGKVDLYATGSDSVLKIAERLPGTRIIGAFETVAFAISTPKGRSPAAKSRLTQAVNEAKAAGIVRRAIEESRLKGAQVAPD